MKKIIFLILIFFPLLLYAQPEYGDGSSGNPYRGTITTPWTLNGDYYCGDLSVTSGVFTIFAGSTLRFGTGNILTISGTGVLSADGTSTDPITFTSSGSTWGHIWFNAPSETNQSVLDYCIIENGDVHSFTDYRGYGGAIHANLSNLTISNCMLRNNYAYWGGAIFVNKSKNPSISNCYIYNNQSSRGGGGIYCWNNSSSVIQNCIFESNVCLEISIPYYSGGGLCAQSYTAVKIINCTFVNNTTTQANGAGIELYSSNNARVINSVFWGSDNQVYLHLTNGNTIINSAIQGSVPSGSVNSIVLNSVNSNPQGPNFNDPDNNDWSIKFISPCRDAGVNSYTGVTIPSKDYIDSSRIGTTDIGAYEVQYSRWTGTTDHTWSTASNWDKNVDPSTGTGDVIIPSGCSQYPDVSTTQDFSILYGNYMIIEPGASVTLDELTNNNGGTLNLKSDATGMFSLMFNSYSGTGTVNTQIYLTGGDAGSGQYRWHYIAVPKTMSKSVLTDINPYNLLRYDDSRITDAKEQGWQWHDGWNGSEPVPSDAFSTLDETRGYNFYHTTNVTATLTTTSLLASIGQINLQNSYPASNLFGWNLVGNSLTCALNWDNVTKSSSVRNAVYYTKNNAMAAYVNGEGVNGGDKYVPPLQGFFVKTDANDEYINLTNAKVHRTSQTYYKKGSSTLERSRIRMEISQNDIKDEMVIRFEKSATDNFDKQYDASKWVSTASIPQIYTSTGNEEYCINTLPFPETSAEIPVGIKIPADGIYSIRKTEISNLDDYNIFLKDLQLNTTTNLKVTPEYSFSSQAGIITGRFVLLISNISTAVNENIFVLKDFNIYKSFGYINIQTLGDIWDGKNGSVKIFDLTGKKITELPNSEFRKNSVLQLKVPDITGIYLVEIRSGLNRFVGKVVIN